MGIGDVAYVLVKVTTMFTTVTAVTAHLTPYTKEKVESLCILLHIIGLCFKPWVN